MLRLLPLPQWPVYSTTLKKVIDKNGAKVYQGQELKRFHEADKFYKHYVEYCANVTECLSVCVQEWPGLTQKGQINTIIDTYVSIFFFFCNFVVLIKLYHIKLQSESFGNHKV